MKVGSDCEDDPDGKILQRGTDTGNSSYVIRSVKLSDEGLYKCTASNQAGKDHYEVQLIIPKCRSRVFYKFILLQLSLYKDQHCYLKRYV